MEWFVAGKPESQGSKTPIRRGGRIILIEGVGDKPSRLNFWRNSIRSTVVAELIDEPVVVTLEFRFVRPKSQPNKTVVDVMPDLDKLCRAVLDALTFNKVSGTGILRNDSRVVQLSATKIYDEPENEGVLIKVEKYARI